jgi:hypothetical protein
MRYLICTHNIQHTVHKHNRLDPFGCNVDNDFNCPLGTYCMSGQCVNNGLRLVRSSMYIVSIHFNMVFVRMCCGHVDAYIYIYIYIAEACSMSLFLSYSVLKRADNQHFTEHSSYSYDVLLQLDVLQLHNVLLHHSYCCRDWEQDVPKDSHHLGNIQIHTAGFMTVNTTYIA